MLKIKLKTESEEISMSATIECPNCEGRKSIRVWPETVSPYTGTEKPCGVPYLEYCSCCDGEGYIEWSEDFEIYTEEGLRNHLLAGNHKHRTIAGGYAS